MELKKVIMFIVKKVSNKEILKKCKESTPQFPFERK